MGTRVFEGSWAPNNFKDVLLNDELLELSQELFPEGCAANFDGGRFRKSQRFVKFPHFLETKEFTTVTKDTEAIALGAGSAPLRCTG